MNFLSRSMPRCGIITVVAVAIVLSACGGGKKTPTADTALPTATTAAATAAVATAPLPTVPPATATSVPATPTPLAATAAAIVATGTALSATSTAFVGTATPGAAQNSGPPSDPQAQAVVDKARARFDQVSALHFTVGIDGDVYLDQYRTQKLKSAEGDLARPDKVSLSAKVQVGPVNASLKFIQIGDTAFLTNILSGKWEKAPSGFAYDPRIVFDQDRGVTAILSNVRGWQPATAMKINGSDTQHVFAPVPTATVNDLVSSSLRGDTVDVDLFIEPKNNDVVRIILSERPDAVAPGTVAARWTLDLTKQNENIKITAPTIGG